MNYWLDLFTGTTWQQFREAGANVSGFSRRRKSTVDRVRPGDILLCYLTGVMHWVGALKVIGPSDDSRPIWGDVNFPVRLQVTPVVALNPEYGIPMEKLRGQVLFYSTPSDAGKFKGFLRGSPCLFKRREDGDLILRLLEDARRNPTASPVDARKLARKPLFKAERRIGKMKVETLVSVPESTADRDETGALPAEAEAPAEHTQMQHLLARLGSEMGLDVWVARNDRSRMQNLGGTLRVLNELPVQFNEATQRTVELIDVLWLKDNSIVAAFEVESTTSIYSGLLRMSDLLALQPNLDVRLYLVAPDDRRGKVEQEIRRPTFKLRSKPLQEVCGYLSFSQLKEKADAIRRLGLAPSLSADFLKNAAEFFE